MKDEKMVTGMIGNKVIRSGYIFEIRSMRLDEIECVMRYFILFIVMLL